MLRACFRNTNSVHRKAASRPTIASLVGPQLRKWSRLFAILPGGAPVLPRSPHLGGGTPSRRPEKAHSGGQPAMQVKRPFEYLSKVVVPVNYVLRFQPDLEAFTFSGSESVSVEVKEAINSITVNVVDIKISVAFFIPEESNKVTGEVSYDDDSEKATITFASQLQPGKGALHLEFTGELNNRMKGFYRSRYTLPSGEERYAAVTQFEATDARRAFPCWDEPSFKATFDVTLVVPQDRTALSNMPVKNESELDSDGSWKVLEYETTPVMSTYLLAFIVGDFDYLEAKDVDGVKIRVFTPVGKKEQGQFALDVAVKTLPFYKDYFQIAYPLPKMDLIAIPDFMSGAMENWGLVTYRETALLIDPENSSSRAKQWVALVVGHELAHQWFGNLVTMARYKPPLVALHLLLNSFSSKAKQNFEQSVSDEEWWTHLWLNEGFASWIEYLCVDKLFPSYQIWTQFVNTDLASALKLDALHTSHPIEVPVGHPTEVDEIFDDISYSKGASVIRMLHGYIEDKDFRKGMNYYLTKFKYNNASTEDLWACLERASGKPVGDVMRTWTKQMGFPVLNVSQSQDENNRILTVKQQKFCADGKLEGDSPQWMIPCEICTSFSPTKPVKTVLITELSSTYTIKNVKPGDWMKLNCGSVGVYRVQYSQEMLDSLLEGIKNKSLLPTDRLEIESDLFALARAGMTSSVDVLNVIQAYKNEDNYTVWNDITQNLSNIAMLLQYTDFYEQYKLFACDLYRTVAESVGWEKEEGEGHLTSLLRELVLCRMGTYDDEKTVREAKRRFQDHLSETNLLSADLKLAVYLTVLKHGDEATLDSMLKLYDKADLLEEKVRIGRSLGAVQDEKLLRRVLDFAMSDKVRSQDTIFVIVGVTRSAEGRKIAWQFVKDNWKELYARYQGGFLVARLVKCTTDGFASEEMAKEVEAFFTAHPAPSAERNIQQSCENIRLNARWMTNESARVGQFLINYSQTSK